MFASKFPLAQVAARLSPSHQPYLRNLIPCTCQPDFPPQQPKLLPQRHSQAIDFMFPKILFGELK
jgi:hypothetical protein